MVGGNFTSGSWLVQQFAPVIGYGLVGVAWWQWRPLAQAGSVGSKAIIRCSKTLALASAAFAATYLSFLYGNLRFRYADPGPNFFIPHFNLHNDGYAAAGWASYLRRLDSGLHQLRPQQPIRPTTPKW